MRAEQSHAPSQRTIPSTVDATLHLPAPVGETRTVSFPAILALAPVVVAVLLWLVLGSASLLAFALLGPVMAVASYVEARRQARREHTRAQERFDRELSACLDRARRFARDDLQALWGAAPGSRLARSDEPAPAPGTFCVGHGPVKVRASVQGDMHALPADARAALDRLLIHEHAPVLVAGSRFSLAGNRSLLLSAGRALLLQGRQHGHPISIGITGVGQAFARELGDLGVACSLVDLSGSVAAQGDTLVLDFGSSVSQESAAPTFASTDAPIQLRMESTSRAVLLSGGSWLGVRPMLVTAEELRTRLDADRWTDSASNADAGHHLSRPSPGDPRSDLSRSAPPGREVSLSAEIGSSRAATFSIDLAKVGPHAVIGGTTGAGKSELLIAWALAMTEERFAHEIQLLCFDFKGGATFDALAALPHCVGIVTDLDPDEARRAAASLQSELRDREQTLREAGAAHIGQVTGLARLVIIVDEYQALVDAGPELQAVFADVSARGRSLGMHLILCAQQPAAAVRGATLSNCSVRVCLRVVSEADSVALVGSAEAAHLPTSAPGLAIFAAGGRRTTVQVERCTPDDITRRIHAAIEREQHVGHAPPRRPWLPALPTQLPLAALDPSLGAAFGLTDDVSARTQAPSIFEISQGAVVVIGGPRTGKTSSLAAIVQAARRAWAHSVLVIDDDPETAWDQLTADTALEAHGLVVIDDVDRLLARIDEPYRTELTARLLRLTRDSSDGSPAMAFSVDRVTAATAQLVAAAPQTLRLMGGDRSSYVLAGGAPADHREGAPPGRAIWRGLPCQVASASQGLRAVHGGEHGSQLGTVLKLRARPGVQSVLLVVSRQGSRLRKTLAAHGFECVSLDDWRREAPSTAAPGEPRAGGAHPHERRRAVIADVESWHSHFGLLPRLAADHEILLSGVTPVEHGTLLKGDPLPPLVLDPARSAVIRDPSGTVRRVRWPERAFCDETQDSGTAVTDSWVPRNRP